MKIAIVKSSELQKHGRWDAGFHIAAQELAGRVDEITRTLAPDASSDEDAQRLAGEKARLLLGELRLEQKKPLLILSRGTNPKPDAATLDRVIGEYPVLSLALLDREMSRAVEEVRAQITEDEAYLERLLEITGTLSPNDEPGPGMGM